MDLSDYDKTLVQAFVEVLFDEGDYKRLTYFLAGKCPRAVGFRPIESALVYRNPNDILLLFDSYDQAANEDARLTILAALGSAFRDIRLATKDDVEFINASRNWFTTNKDRLKVNRNYSPYYKSENNNLFVIR